MAGEWKKIWTLVAAIIERQPPPMQIFIWLSVAFVVVMFVEGLRVSFLPYRFRKDLTLKSARTEELSPPSVSRTNQKTLSFDPRRAGPTRARKLIDTAPRRVQAHRPKIRRVSSSFEIVPRCDGREQSQATPG